MHVVFQYCAAFGLVASLSGVLTRAGVRRAHWFAVHALANLVVCALTLPAFAYAVRHPDWIAFRPAQGSPELDELNGLLIGMLHVYHVGCYQDVSAEDWLHHVLFIPFNQVALHAPRLFGWNVRWGAGVNMQHFFICGLPGALDYASLVLYKHGHMTRLQQKWCQSKLNLWLRCPGTLLTIALLGQGTVRQRAELPWGAVLIIALDALLIGFNSLYYTERVLRSHAISTTKIAATSGTPPP